MNPINILDPEDKRISPYYSLKGKKLESDGIFIGEGDKIVKLMIRRGLSITSLLVGRDGLSRHRGIIKTLSCKGVPVYVAERDIVESIIGFRFHRGILAAARCPEKNTVRELFNVSRTPSLIAALDGVNDPQNVGLIVRNAAAFGADALIIDSSTHDPYYRKSVRVSMGTLFNLPICYEADIRDALLWLKKAHSVRIIAATLNRKAKDICKVRFSGNICLVFGNEDRGVSSAIADIADVEVRIPISESVDSLNVASASAVLLYAASRVKG